MEQIKQLEVKLVEENKDELLKSLKDDIKALEMNLERT